MKMRIQKTDFWFLCFFIVLIFGFSLHGSTATLNQAEANDCAVATNGTILVAGKALVGNANQFLVAQYTADGALDDSFNGSGFATTAIGTSANALGVVTQSTGQTIAVGYAFVNGATQIALASYLSDGSLNINFGNTGIVTTALGNGASGNAITQDASGNLIVAGVANYSYTPQFFVARYNSINGGLDTTFNALGSNPGVASLIIGYRAWVNALAIQSDGRILLAGSASFGTGDQFALARFNTDGSLDTTFNSTGSQPGVITTQIGTMATIQGIALQSDGTIIVAGSSDGSLCLASYTTTGQLNTSFGDSGIVINSIGDKSQANGVIIDESGNIIMSGISDDSLLIIRYTSAGVLDTSFNTTGYSIFGYQGASGGNAIQLLSNTNMIIAGYFVSTVTDFLLVAYTSAGVLDSSWQINGVINAVSNSVVLSDVEAIGTNGGTFTSGQWVTRTLNTISTPGIATLANNQFTLNPGIYTISALAPAYKVDSHQIRLQNITNGVTTLAGSTAYSPYVGGSMTASSLNGEFTITVPTVFEIQHICATTEENDGLGIASGLNTELYTTVTITSNFNF